MKGIGTYLSLEPSPEMSNPGFEACEAKRNVLMKPSKTVSDCVLITALEVGAVCVDNMNEFYDILAAFKAPSIPKGNQVAMETDPPTHQLGRRASVIL